MQYRRIHARRFQPCDYVVSQAVIDDEVPRIDCEVRRLESGSGCSASQWNGDLIAREELESNRLEAVLQQAPPGWSDAVRWCLARDLLFLKLAYRHFAENRFGSIRTTQPVEQDQPVNTTSSLFD